MTSKAEVMEALEFLCDFNDSEEYQNNLLTVIIYIGNLGDIINKYNILFDDVKKFAKEGLTRAEEIFTHKTSKEEE